MVNCRKTLELLFSTNIVISFQQREAALFH